MTKENEKPAGKDNTKAVNPVGVFGSRSRVENPNDINGPLITNRDDPGNVYTLCYAPPQYGSKL